MAKIELFEKTASVECDFDWWPKFQVIVQFFMHNSFANFGVVLQMESGKLA